MSGKEISQYILTSAVTTLIVVLGYFGSKSLDELVKIREQVADLNVKMVSIVGNQDHFQKELDKMDKRVEKLESKP